VDAVDCRQFASLGLLPLALPAPELPLDVRLLASQVAEPHLVGRDLMDRDQRVDQPLADRAALVLVELLRILGGAQDRTLDEAHHVERRPVHRLVLAEADHRRNRDESVLKRADHAVLAPHVVGRAETLAKGRAAERPGVAGRVTDAEGQVGTPAGDPLKAERQLDTGNVRLEPALDPGAIDPLGRFRGCGLVSLLAHGPSI
jgi:hypothetical protein